MVVAPAYFLDCLSTHPRPHGLPPCEPALPASKRLGRSANQNVALGPGAADLRFGAMPLPASCQSTHFNKKGDLDSNSKGGGNHGELEHQNRKAISKNHVEFLGQCGHGQFPIDTVCRRRPSLHAPFMPVLAQATSRLHPPGPPHFQALQNPDTDYVAACRFHPRVPGPSLQHTSR